jgi:hypothetical protein
MLPPHHRLLQISPKITTTASISAAAFISLSTYQMVDISPDTLKSVGPLVAALAASGSILMAFISSARLKTRKILGVTFGVISILGIFIGWFGGHITDIRLQSLQTEIRSVERYSADRLLEDNDIRRFVGIPHEGLILHVFSLTGDREGERFAKNIKQQLGAGLGLHWRVDISTVDEDKLGTGALPGAIFGPFGGDEKTPMLSTATIMLYSAFLASDFCIDMRVPLSIRSFADPSPSAISLVIGPKDRKGVICR